MEGSVHTLEGRFQFRGVERPSARRRRGGRRRRGRTAERGQALAAHGAGAQGLGAARRTPVLPCCQLVGEKRWERRRSSLDWFADGREGSGSAADTTTVVYDSASCKQYSLALSIATVAAALGVEPAELTRKKGRRRKLAPLWRKLARCVGFARDRPPGARPHLALVRTAADVDTDAAAAASGGGGLGAGAAGAAAAAACSSQVAVESARGQLDAAAAADALLAGGEMMR